MSQADNDNEKILEVLADVANGLEALAVNLKRQIAELAGVKGEQKASWNPDKIKWEKAEGFKGEFERSEDVDSLDFKEMLKDLAAHQGKLSRDGYFYWTFQNGSTVGRKKRQKQT